MKRFSTFLCAAFTLLLSIHSFAQMTTIQGTVSNLPSGLPITVNSVILAPYESPIFFSTVTDSSGFYSFSNHDIDSFMQHQTSSFIATTEGCNFHSNADTIFGVINSGTVVEMDFDYCPPSATACSANFTLSQINPITQVFTPNQAWLINGSTGSNLSYTWYFGDGTSGTGLNLSHTYPGNGPYNLCLNINDGAGCLGRFCDTLSVDSSGVITKMANGFTVHIVEENLGTEEIETPSITVYPNPTSDVLFLQLDIELFDHANYILTDVNGRTIIREQVKGSTTQIDVSMLPPGLYFVKVQDQKYNLIQKITIE